MFCAAYQVHQVSIDVHEKTAAVVFRDPPRDIVDGASIKILLGFKRMPQEGGKRAVSEALQVLREALLELTGKAGL
jgi:hypothetical protein